MDLKKISEKWTSKTFTSEILSTGEKVYGSGYSVGDDLELVGLHSLDDKKFFFANVVSMLQKKYSLKPAQFNNLTMPDIHWLVKDLKIHSDGPEIVFSYQCGHCKEDNKDKIIDLSTFIVTNKDAFKKNIEIDESTLITFKYINYAKFFDIVENIDKKMTIDEKIDMLKSKNKKSFIDSIESITVGTETKLATDILPEDLEAFAISFPRKIYKKFLEYYDNLPKVDLPTPICCSKCGKPSDLDISDFFGLLL